MRIIGRFGAAAAVLAVMACGTGRVLADEWGDVQDIVGKVQGVSVVPPRGVVSAKYTTGALMGNGEIGVAAGDRMDQQTFYFGKSDFWGTHWNPGHSRMEPSILSLGGMTVSSREPSENAVGAYKMVQDVLHGEVRTTMRLGKTVVEMKSWTADGDNVFVTEFSSGVGSGAVVVDVSLWMPPAEFMGHGAYPFSVGEEKGVLWATRTGDEVGQSEWSGVEKFQARAAIGMKVVGADFSEVKNGEGKVTGSFRLEAGKTVRIACVFRTDARVGTGGPTTERLKDVAVADAGKIGAADIAALSADHLRWWKDFWLTSYVRLNDKVLEDYYYGAMYVMGCTAREGHLCPPMFGAWVTSDNTAWGARYFNNYNIQAPFYGVCSSNRPGMTLPYAELVFAELPYQMNRTARAGYTGVCSTRTYAPFDFLSGKTPLAEPVAEKKDWTKLPTDQKSNAAFTAMPAMWYWEYTHDEKYLREKLYPELKALDAFWRDYLVWDEAGKRWVVEHSAAHEETVANDVNPNLDLGFIRKGERLLLETSAVLGVDADLRPKWQDVLDHLSAYPTGTVDGKEVFFTAEKLGRARARPFEVGGQPVNMEGGVFPGENIYLGGDEHQLQMARDSLDLMSCWGLTRGGNSNNGFCKEFPIAARVGWPAENLILKLRLAILAQWRPSNLTVFQGGGGIETSGTIEAINSMLLQGEGGTIRVFPNWPKERDASFKRLRAKGAFVLSSEMKGGLVTGMELTSEKGGTVRLINPWQTIPHVEMAGAAIETTNENGAVTFLTKAGETYVLGP